MIGYGTYVVVDVLIPVLEYTGIHLNSDVTYLCHMGHKSES